MIWTEALPFFPRHELACKHCDTVRIDVRFAAMLPALRARWGGPLTPTSVCRCPEHNKAVGGHPRSLHLTVSQRWPTHGSMAADIRWVGWDPQEQLGFAQLAYSMGFAVGLHDLFCHVDGRGALDLEELPQAVFVYGQWSGEFGEVEIK